MTRGKHWTDEYAKQKAKEYSARWRAKNYEQVRRRERERRGTPEGRTKQKAYYANCLSQPRHRIQNLIRKAKARATAKGLAYSEVLFASLKADPPTVCACCGKAFDFALAKGHNRDSASFDRVDNSRGYIEGNVAVICRRCNRIKADATATELETIAAYIRAHQREEVECCA